MKYRIKITTFKNGRKEFVPQFKKIIWINLSYSGGLDVLPSECNSRNRALEIIDDHYNGNTKKQTIEFEYITK